MPAYSKRGGKKVEKPGFLFNGGPLKGHKPSKTFMA